MLWMKTLFSYTDKDGNRQEDEEYFEYNWDSWSQASIKEWIISQHDGSDYTFQFFKVSND